MTKEAIKMVEGISKRTEHEEEQLKKAREDLQRDQQDLETWDEDSTIAEQILEKRKNIKPSAHAAYALAAVAASIAHQNENKLRQKYTAKKENELMS